MAQKETRKHFGNSIMMFTPLYIANYCENYCIYCGFNCYNNIRRKKLTNDEQNAIIMKHCIEYIKQHPEWQLSLQTHKIIGIQ